MQGEFFDEVPQPIRVRPPAPKPLTAEDVRDQMLALISKVRSADAMPFGDAELKHHVAMFPIMAQWLAPEDGEQLVLQFKAEVERLRLAA